MSNVHKLIDDAMMTMAVDSGTVTLAYFISRIGVSVVNNPDVPACAYTNGKGIFINEYCIEKMNEQGTDTGNNGKTYNTTISKRNLIFILAHEVMHLLTNTFERGEALGILRDDFSDKGKMKNELWNIATDFEINSLLHNNKQKDSGGFSTTSKPIGDKPDWCCYDDKYIDWPAEKIYEELLQKVNNNSLQAGGQSFTFDNNDGQGNGGSGDGDGDSNGNSGSNGNGKSKQSNGLKYGLDSHMPFADEMTKSEVMAKASDVFGNISGDGQGTGMTAFDRALNIAFKPQPFNWRRALTRYIKSFMKENYTWNKPSRAGIANGLILPSTSTTPKLHVAIAVDTSGSIGETELELLMNHVFTILSQFKQFQVDVWCCSTHVHENTFRTYTAANKSKLKDFKVESDGGTYMTANLDFIKKKYAKKMPDVVMIFTDGEDNLNGDTETRTNYPILWLIVDNKNFKKPAKIPGAVYPFETRAN